MTARIFKPLLESLLAGSGVRIGNSSRREEERALQHDPDRGDGQKNEHPEHPLGAQVGQRK